ncbi:hypothetical protein [Veronia pacifica]|uniref:START domain-containing protein n=1 Tax=Veronia pacifica TaxID=1080227 RepID=A0A1C3EIC0_9GAMM|nr:hypothetical protein [Veronia pacifica]ODA32985.1 hypothetical protein A8L45_11855 [Veronia pacifica]
MKPVVNNAKAAIQALLFWLVPFSAAAEVRGSDGALYSDRIVVKSYTGLEDIYDTVIGRVLINVPIEKPVLMLTQTEKFTHWVHSLVDTEVVKEHTPADKTLHIVFSAPLGIKNRDAYLRFTYRRVNHLFTMTLAQEKAYPESDNAVRMTDIKGHFRFEDVGNGQLAAELKLHINPNHRPIFAVNANTRSVVKNTLRNFIAHTERQKTVTVIPNKLASAMAVR